LISLFREFIMISLYNVLLTNVFPKAIANSSNVRQLLDFLGNEK